MIDKNYFTEAFKEEEGGTPVVEDNVQTETAPIEQPVEKEVEPTQEEEVDAPTTFTIDGEEYTLEQLKEWKNSGLRQSDYTKKTQELARQRKEFEENKRAIENGEEVKPKSAELRRLEEIENQLATERLDREIAELKNKYNDFDEVKVLQEADRLGLYDDLEFVYKGLRDTKTNANINVDEMKAQLRQELLNEINASNVNGTSIISSGDTSTQPTNYSDYLTQEELAYANKRGWSAEEYYKMKTDNYNI